MHQWWAAAAVPIVGALGYLLRRWIEGRAQSELLKRRLQALALHQGMERTGVSLGDLDKLGHLTARGNGMLATGGGLVFGSDRAG